MEVQTSNVVPFVGFPSISRVSRDMVITEKLDGTNAQVHITEDGRVLAGSRTRWITPEGDNYGFAKWVKDHETELQELGPGSHFGEWWGAGIQRRYGKTQKTFSLFNVSRWAEGRPECCDLVPVLYRGLFSTETIDDVLGELADKGSYAAPGFMKPEGIVIWHEAARILFKKTLDKNDGHKGVPNG